MENIGDNPPLTEEIIIETAKEVLSKKGKTNLNIVQELESRGYDVESFGQNEFLKIVRLIRRGKI